jgi:hypothetical protein
VYLVDDSIEIDINPADIEIKLPVLVVLEEQNVNKVETRFN